MRLERTQSVADGLLPLEVGSLPLRLLQDGGVDAAQVTDDAIRAATRWLLAKERLLAEPSGAATTAAVLSGAVQVDGPTVLIVSGGNIELETIAQWG